MSDKVIIDVDVSECTHFDKDNHQRKVFDCYEIEGFPNFCKGDNCYYKQLQRLKAENEKLKEKNEELIAQLSRFYRKKEYIRLLKYKQALEEIREISSPHCSQCREIIDKINEVLK